MARGEEVVSTPRLYVGGVVLPPTVAASLVLTWVESSFDLPDQCELQFHDVGGTVLEQAHLRLGTSIRLEVLSSAAGTHEPLFVGDVTALEAQVTEEGRQTVVRALGTTHKLFRGTRVRAFVQKSAHDIAKDVVQGAGLGIKADPTRPVLDHLSQDGVSDWEFLQRLGRLFDRTVWLRDGVVQFTARPDASAAPAPRSDNAADPLVLQATGDLHRLSCVMSSDGQVSSVEVRGWDPRAKRAVVATARPAAVHAHNGLDPAATLGSHRPPPRLEPLAGCRNADEAKAAADSIVSHVGGGYADLEGSARGNPKLRAGVPVAITGMGQPFDGRYTVSSARHEFTPDDGYTTHFTVSNASNRSLHGSSNGAPATTKPRWPGAVPAVVTNANDPDKLGRVKVKMDFLASDYESRWCRVLQPGAGKSRGLVLLPEVGDEVLVAFGHGSFDDPYVLGGLYNGREMPSEPWQDHVGGDGKVRRRAWTSRTGMQLEFIESPQEEKLTISTNTGAQHLTLTQKPSEGIELVSMGPLSITAEKDVNVESRQGLTVKSAQALTVEAGRDLTLKSTGGNVSIEGLQVQVKGQAALKLQGATTELAGTAMTTVRGAMVKIN